MIKTLNSLIVFILLFSAFNAFAATGPATEYKVTMTKIELCETGSTTANCLNALTISPTGTSGAVDIAAVDAGATAGSYGNIAKAKIGTLYTYIQITMSRQFSMTGTAGSCATKAGETGSKTADAAGQTGGTPGSSTLYVPDSSSYDDHMNGSVDSLGATVSNDGVVGSSDEYFQYRKIISGNGLRVKAGDFPTVKVAFDVSNAVGEGTGGAAACTANVMYANEPGMTISFVD
ncbi:hypothetical protein OA430_02525 [Candidatus Pelagibacter sp.]|nr:hypothetical protein [Candidatus Pelagibacter sp.]